MVIPTDRGVRVLGSCNEGYMNMIHTLEELVEGGNLPNYTVPRARQQSQLFYCDGTTDYSILKYVHSLKGKSVLLYRQPYSERSLDRVVHELGRRYNMMKELFQENEKQKLRQKLEGDLNIED